MTAPYLEGELVRCLRAGYWHRPCVYFWPAAMGLEQNDLPFLLHVSPNSTWSAGWQWSSAHSGKTAILRSITAPHELSVIHTMSLLSETAITETIFYTQTTVHTVLELWEHHFRTCLKCRICFHSMSYWRSLYIPYILGSEAGKIAAASLLFLLFREWLETGCVCWEEESLLPGDKRR